MAGAHGEDHEPSAAFPRELTDGLAQLLGQDWSSKLSLLSWHGTVDPERILPAVLLLAVPVGLRGLLLVALLAAAMSTFNAIANATTAFLTRDLYQGYIRPKAKNKELITVTYGFGALVMGIGFVIGLLRGEHQRYLGVDHHGARRRHPDPDRAPAVLVEV